MPPIQFSSIFANRRKELKLTQEDVAQFVGVSRAAVSKWEQGLSYPDITLLPKLAMLLDLTIDSLLGYQPQLTAKRIAELYSELAQRFAKEEFAQVDEAIQQLIKEYYSCYPFLSKMAQLYLNYLPQSPDPPATADTILQFCSRVRQYSDDMYLINEVTAIEAATHLLLKQPQQVIEQLGSRPRIEFNHELLIASALAMMGDEPQAKRVLQVSAYQHLLSLFGVLTELMALEKEQAAYVDVTVDRLEKLAGIFGVHELSIHAVLVFYLKAANVYAMQQNEEQAARMVERYLQRCKTLKFPLQFSGDDYFYLLQEWIDEEQTVMQQAPRDMDTIKRDLLAAVDANPLLAPLLQRKELAILYENVKHVLKEV